MRITLITLLSWLLLSCASTGPPPDDSSQVDKAHNHAFCEKSVQKNMHAAAQRHQLGMPLQSIILDFAQFSESQGIDKAYRNAVIELIAAMLMDRNSMMGAYQKAVRVCVELQ